MSEPYTTLLIVDHSIGSQDVRVMPDIVHDNVLILYMDSTSPNVLDDFELSIEMMGSYKKCFKYIGIASTGPDIPTAFVVMHVQLCELLLDSTEPDTAIHFFGSWIDTNNVKAHIIAKLNPSHAVYVAKGRTGWGTSNGNWITHRVLPPELNNNNNNNNNDNEMDISEIYFDIQKAQRYALTFEPTKNESMGCHKARCCRC